MIPVRFQVVSSSQAPATAQFAAIRLQFVAFECMIVLTRTAKWVLEKKSL